MTTSTRTPNRQPAGVPIGGQFATESRGRAALSLDSGNLDAADAWLAENDTETDDVSRGSVSDLLSDDEARVLLDQARESGKFFAYRFGHNNDHVAEESASRAMLAYLEARARAAEKDAAEAAGEVPDDQELVEATDRMPTSAAPENLRAYIHSTVLTQTINAMADANGASYRSVDSHASKELERQVAARSVELKRNVTLAERRQMADAIRMSYPAGARPNTNFGEPDASKRRVVPLDSEALGYVADVQSAQGIGAQEHAIDTETVPGSFRERAEQALAIGGRGGQLSAVRHAWSLVAETSGGPHPIEGSMTEYSAAKTRKTIAMGGGAVEIARRVRTGTATAEETSALLKPFGNLDDHDRAAALEIITRNPSYGADLWDSSVLAATRIIERKK